MSDLQELHDHILFSVRNRMTELRINDAELGFKAHIAQSAISRFFKGTHVPSLKTITRVADALDMDLEVLLKPRG